ncbi:hypothetical protein HNV11_18580 [Spirosoma taeanense]|uniref:Uncharacterized protein n=1 Tax=Spirosoma taeanense TaxID=2735870 RepID=A0A6M5YAL8_9BACT|nr:hypothetical protein [Spirosoma taeanense]QJW91237.1 hypothetical protein HNV11_18580 [Spirosoma taeanense]
MYSYLVAHYVDDKPTFIYAETLEAARGIALASIQQNPSTGVLSIVEIATDRIVYYGKGEKQAAKLNALGRPTATAWLSRPPVFKHFLNWVSLKLARLTI